MMENTTQRKMSKSRWKIKQERRFTMSYLFTVEKAATIQCLKYNSLDDYKKDLERRNKRNMFYEVLHEETGANGTYLVTMKIPVSNHELVGYNDFKKFM